jgi:two-component system chemotaxis response regulator CheB
VSVRVLVVDDSSFFRKRLVDIISADTHLEVVGTAENGLEAIQKVKTLKPDVITMDIEMPEMDGISATQHIMNIRPTPILILSSWSTEGAQATLNALEAGAIDYVPKHLSEVSAHSERAHKKLCLQLRYLASHSSHTPSVIQTPPQHLFHKHPNKPIKLIAIGASTGGPVALQKILTQLPKNYPYPILLIQHMPATFTPSFADRLNKLCKVTVKQAENGDLIEPGKVYLAPGGEQMVIKGTHNQPKIEILKRASEDTYSPCIDTTLESLAKLYKDDVLTIILTGMGSDGAKGCKLLKSQGITIWSQDEQSSTIYGMPKAIAKAHLADKILSLDDIALQLSELN